MPDHRCSEACEHVAMWTRPQSVADVFRILTHNTVIDRAGDRIRYGGVTDEFARQLLLKQRGGKPQSAEDAPPRGYAADWYTRVLGDLTGHDKESRRVPPSGVQVARQLARLAGDGREFIVSDRSLADAVGRVDRLGRLDAYMEGGRVALEDHGFITRTVTGRGRGARTTYRLIRPDSQ